MPSDANGVYSLPDGYLAVTGAPIQASQHNPPLEDLGSAMTGRLPRSGVAPMTGPLRVPDGTVDTPTLAFASDPSAGFYLSGGKIIPTKPMGGVRYIGELVFGSFHIAPPLCVLPAGQTLSRITYADLWVHAQASIAAGHTFYNNGDGSTTFGIGDARGNGFFVKDDNGGSPANRVTVGLSGITGNLIGSMGGSQNRTIAQAQLPNVALTFSGSGSASVNSGSVFVPQGSAGVINVATIQASGTGSTWNGVPTNINGNATLTSTGTASVSGATSSINGAVAQAGLIMMPPTLIVGCALYAGA